MNGYTQVNVYGKLLAGYREYWIAAPYPIEVDTPWGEKERGFLGVDVYKPIDKNGEDVLYPTLYPIIVSGTWHVILKPPVNGWIWCKESEMLVAGDFLNVAVVDPEEPEWLAELASEFEFDLVREIV